MRITRATRDWCDAQHRGAGATRSVDARVATVVLRLERFCSVIEFYSRTRIAKISAFSKLYLKEIRGLVMMFSLSDTEYILPLAIFSAVLWLVSRDR